MRRIIIESPYAGDIDLNVAYARACMRDAILRGEAPFASHLLYTQPGILNDSDPHERELGIRLGFEWGKTAAATVVYLDRGLSPGMERGIREAERDERPVEYRKLHWEPQTERSQA